MSEVIEVPCSCMLSSILDPDFEPQPCACMGPCSATASTGEVGYVGIVRTAHPRGGVGPHVPEEFLALAHVALYGREKMGLREWVEAVQAAARAAVHPG
jgi:hypothetical protein